VDGGAACAAESFTFAYPPVVHDAGVTDAHTDAGNPCTTTVAGCVTTQDCTYVVAGDTTKTTDVQTVSSSGGVTGTHSSTTKNADGGVVGEPCTYTYTWSEGSGSGTGTGSGTGSGTGTGTGSGT
jgi:hypothetical protein